MAMPERLVRRSLRLFAALHRCAYQLTGGALGGRILGAPVLLLTTTGRQSGKLRTTPLLYLEDGAALVVIASNGGAPSHPGWFLNLEADPEVEVQVRRERRALRAHRASPSERERLWPRALAVYKAYEDYQRKTEREIPVVLLESPPDS
jgi:deazaflavin-dependent oxidoreductase (nitroreductase family)